MNFVFWYIVVGLVIAAIAETYAATSTMKDWYGIYKPTLVSLVISTILWPVVVYKLMKVWIES